MYLNFDVKTIDGKEVPYSHAPWSITENQEGPYSVDLYNYPQYVTITQKKGKDDEGNEIIIDTIYKQNIWLGWFLFPKYSFNRDRYTEGEDPFDPYDYTKSETFQRIVRTHILSGKINQKIQGFVELKMHRRALKRIIELLETIIDIVNDTEIKRFKEFNTQIEEIISELPKDTTGLENLEIKRMNEGEDNENHKFN